LGGSPRRTSWYCRIMGVREPSFFCLPVLAIIFRYESILTSWFLRRQPETLGLIGMMGKIFHFPFVKIENFWN